MSQKILFTMLFSLVSTAAFAQKEDIAHHDVSFSVGAAVPTGSDTNYLAKAPMISLTYGYRFDRFFKAGAGFQMAFGAANNQNVEDTEFGSSFGGDHEFMIPFTGQFIIPLPLRKWEISTGGGPVYLHYAETPPSGAVYCFTCTSRGGWGLQGLANVRYFLNDDKTFHVGTTGQYVSATLNGDPVGSVPGTQTRDHWYNVLVEIGFSF
jgi:hypothetical protein